MRYFMDTDGEYILSYGVGGTGGDEITEEQYNAILSAVASAPEETETTTYRLKTDLTWEPVAIEPVDPDIDEREAYDIIFGGAE